jgi:hypothetical protein
VPEADFEAFVTEHAGHHALVAAEIRSAGRPLLDNPAELFALLRERLG